MLFYVSCEVFIKLEFIIKNGNSLQVGIRNQKCKSSSLLLIRFFILENGYLSLYNIDRTGTVTIIEASKFYKTGTYDFKQNGNLKAVNLTELKGKQTFIAILTKKPVLKMKEQYNLVSDWYLNKANSPLSNHYDYFDAFSIVVE